MKGDRGRLMRLVKDLLGDRWRWRMRALGRFRWIAKYRILRDAGLSPREHLRYVLLDPELESFSYRIANVDGMLAAIAEVTGVPPGTLASYAAEPDDDHELGDGLARRLRWRFDVKRRPQIGSRLAWYVFVRAMRPSLVLETGIHNGLGSLTILRALERNRTDGAPGRLVSFDLSPDAGWMVDRRRSPDWQVVVGRTDETLEATVGDQQVDILIHDTIHTDENQRMEFGIALRHAGPRLLIVDMNAGACPILATLSDELGGAYYRVSLGAADHWYQQAGIAFAMFPGPTDETR